MKISQHPTKWIKGVMLSIVVTPALLFGKSPAESFDQQFKGQVNHIIVIYQENWSFDGLYGQFPGVNGLANAFSHVPQWDKSTGYTTYLYQTPQPSNEEGGPDLHFPPGNGQPALPLVPFSLLKYIPSTGTTGDIVHRFYHEQLQLDTGVLEPSKGSMDKFVTWSDNPGLVLSGIDATDLPEGRLAQKYTICDNFFHSVYGGSFLNHQFFVAAAAPQWRQPIPAGFQSNWNPTTRTLADGNLTIDGRYVVNTTYGSQMPRPAGIPANKLLLPINDVDPAQPGYTPTIGDRLDGAGVSWKWYAGGWNDALAGHADPLFQYHHQPFGYYAKYAPFNPDGTLNPTTTGPQAHLQDEQNFLADVSNDTLPAVSFVKALGPDNEHPGYASLLQGQQHVAGLVAAVQKSKFWKDTVIIITYDENGGRWDHVTPPVMSDGWGLGTRVPTIIVSRFTAGGVVDSTQYETVSILKLIERRFSLAPLSPRDANPAVNDLTTALKFCDHACCGQECDHASK
jgi:phospholipase C